MFVCLMCGNSNSIEANYCSICNAVLPKIGIDQVSSAARGSVKFDKEKLKFYNSGFYKGFRELLVIYSEGDISSEELMEALEIYCDEILDFIERVETLKDRAEENRAVSEELKELLSGAYMDVAEGAEMMLGIYEELIENLNNSREVLSEPLFMRAEEADKYIVNGKNDFIDIIQSSFAEEFRDGVVHSMEDLFYKKKTSMPENLYGGDHVSFDIL